MKGGAREGGGSLRGVLVHRSRGRAWPSSASALAREIFAWSVLGWSAPAEAVETVSDSLIEEVAAEATVHAALGKSSPPHGVRQAESARPRRTDVLRVRRDLLPEHRLGLRHLVLRRRPAAQRVSKCRLLADARRALKRAARAGRPLGSSVAAPVRRWRRVLASWAAFCWAKFPSARTVRGCAVPSASSRSCRGDSGGQPCLGAIARGAGVARGRWRAAQRRTTRASL